MTPTLTLNSVALLLDNTSNTRRFMGGIALSLLLTTSIIAQSDNSNLRKAFSHPPDNSKIMVRWWWFGPAVTKPELTRELEAMKAAGIGGVEIATLYPQALDDPLTGFKNTPFLSDAYIDNLRYASEETHRLGLRVDITLGSGWPLGGPHIPVTEAAGMLRVETFPIPVGTSSVKEPSLENGESLIQGFAFDGVSTESTYGASLTAHLNQARHTLDLRAPASNPGTAIFFIASRTGMMVKRPAIGASGFVLDHYDKNATDTHLHAVGDRMLQAFGSDPPYAVFSDSLEDYGSDWTPALITEFQKRRGYDLTPYLPALVGDIGPSTDAIRHDWGRTLTELADENFLQPMHAWAADHHTLLRSQTYGFPPVTLSSNRFADLPEGEGKATLSMWREFSDTRWAASAGHLFGHNVISSETWTWLHSPAFRANLLDMKAEADLHFLQGINQLVGHGWPYSPPGVEEPGWRMYAAASLNDHNPWFPVMSDLDNYLQRVSFALRQGKPANDVAILLPNDDVWSSLKARIKRNSSTVSAAGFDDTGSNVSIDESMPKFLDSKVIPQILDAGFDCDFIDGDAIDSVGIPYKVLVLPNVNRLPVDTYKKILSYAEHGGIVIATGRTPATSPGFLQSEKQSEEIRSISETLFHGNLRTTHFISDAGALGKTLASEIPPDVKLSPAISRIGFIHRKLDHGDLYFIANTGNQVQHTQIHFRTEAKQAEEWGAFTGKISTLPSAQDITLEFAPYESHLLYRSDEPPEQAVQTQTVIAKSLDLSHGWHVTFPSGKTLEMNDLYSWTDDSELRDFSGLATYEKTIDVPSDFIGPPASVLLDFGIGKAEPEPQPLGIHNMRAYIESPVREAAEVYVNGQLAGAVWHPPYQLEISNFIKPGRNQLRIVVANTAINELSDQPKPDYRLLYDRYGQLFIPQDMDHLQPLPSGMFGPVTLKVFEAKH